jgi:phage gp46-like protein
MSLYTDQRADVDDPLPDPNSEDRRGWWGDQISDFEDDKIGSKLWLLERSSTKETVLTDVKFYIEQALQWMIDDGVAQEIDVTTERWNRKDGSATLAVQIEIKQSSGGVTAIKFDDLWKVQIAS